MPHLGLLRALLLLAPLPAAANTPPPSPERLARAEEWMRSEVLRAGFPGASLAVAHRGRLVLSTAVGVADLDRMTPVGPDTRFNIASMTKSVTATALLQLRDRGLVDLDAPVQRYLPWFRVADEQASRAITLRHLLQHTSGLPVNSHGVIWDDPDGIRDSLEHGVRALASVHLHHPPGISFEYANMNYAILGLVIETVAGEPFADYLEEHIFRPLGMANTTTGPGRADPRRVATPYGPWFGRLGEMPLTIGNFTAPASAVVSTAPDMARYASAHLSACPTPLLSPASLREAHQGGPELEPGARYGYGWIESRSHGVTLIHHGGAAGHSGAIYLVPEHDLALVLLVGGYACDTPNQIAAGLIAILLGHEPPRIGSWGELSRLLWLSRLLFAATIVAVVLLFVLAWRIVRGGRPLPLRLAALRALLLVAVAAFLWHLCYALVPARVPEIPLPFGFRGWPVDVAVSIGAMLPCAYLWAAFALIGLYRSVRRR